MLKAVAVVIDRGGRVAERLLNIFRLKRWVLCEEHGAVRISCEQLQNATNGDAHSADARFSGAFARLYRNAIERTSRGHVISLEHLELERSRQHDSLPTLLIPLGDVFA